MNVDRHKSIDYFMSVYLTVLGIIQLWRRVTDSALIDECTDDIVIDDTTVKSIGGICFERARSRKYMSINRNHQ
jgi:hypothetical protein